MTHNQRKRTSLRNRNRRLLIESLEHRRVLATFAVNTTEDTIDIDLSDGLAIDSNGNTSLRAAVMQANATPANDVITLPAGLYELVLGGLGGSPDAEGDLDIFSGSGNLVIRGEGASQTEVRSNFSRVFSVGTTADLTLEGLSVRGRLGDNGDGGAILSLGELQLDNVQVEQSDAIFGGGVALLGGNFSAVQSAFVFNQALDLGGAIYIGGGVSNVTILNSTIDSNSAGLEGGGISIDTGSNADVVIDYTTVTANAAPVGENLAAPDGFGGGGGRVEVSRSIIGDGSATDESVIGQFTTGGNNIVSVARSGQGFVDGTLNDLVGTAGSPVDPLLTPLARKSASETVMRGLLSDSPAVDHVTTSGAGLVDQRGNARDADDAPDAGAFEFVGGRIEVRGFHDRNGNGGRNPTFEELVGFDVNLRISSVRVDGTPEIRNFSNVTLPFAIDRLDAGDHTVTATLIAGQELTLTRDRFTVTLQEERIAANSIGATRFGEIYGYKFGDRLGDARDATDPRLANVTINLISAGIDGQFGTGDDVIEQSTTTDVDGNYAFTGISFGDYQVRPELGNDRIQTTAVNETLTIRSGTVLTAELGAIDVDGFQTEELVTSLAIGCARPAVVRGRVVLDRGQNGPEASDPGIATFDVTLLRRGPDGRFRTADDIVVATATSDANGHYEFENIREADRYAVRLESKDRYFSTQHLIIGFNVRLNDVLVSDAARQPILETDQTAVVVPRLAFGVQRFVGVFGLTFDDLNANGVFNPNSSAPLTEVPFPNQTVELLSEVRGQFQTVGSTRSDNQGVYGFDDLSDVTYVVNQRLGRDRGQTTSEVPFTTEFGSIYVANSFAPGDFLEDFEEGLINVVTVDALSEGSRALVQIRGNIVDDLNADGVETGGETGLENWTVVLRRTERRYEQDSLPNTMRLLTDASGEYSAFVWPGSYEVAEILRPGFEPTGPRYRFEEFTSIATGQGSSVSKVSGVVFADVNGDGLDEAVVANDFSDVVNRTSSISVIFNGGAQVTEIPLGLNVRPSHIVPTDLEGDGDMDFVVAASGFPSLVTGQSIDLAFGTVLILRNNNGMLQLQNSLGQPIGGNLDGTVGLPVNQSVAGNSPSYVDAKDLNRDGLVDLVIVNAATYDPTTNRLVQHEEDISIAMQVSPGVFVKTQTLDLSETGFDADVISAAIADVNNDGIEDIAVGVGGASQVTVFLGRRNLPFTETRTMVLSGIGRPAHVHATDLNDDGLDDLVVSDYRNNALFIYEQGLNGIPTTGRRIPVARKPQWVATGDINADGTSDILVSFAGRNDVQPIFNLGNARFVPGPNSEVGRNLRFTASSPLGNEVAFGKVAIGNVNGDRFGDVAVAHFTQGISIHENLLEVFSSWDSDRPSADAANLIGPANFVDFLSPSENPPLMEAVVGANAPIVAHTDSIRIPLFAAANFQPIVDAPDFANHRIGVPSLSGLSLTASSTALDRPFQNAANPYDVNSDGLVTPKDVLHIIHAVNSGKQVSEADGFVDVSGDSQLSARDALLAIHFINSTSNISDSDRWQVASSEVAIAEIQEVASEVISLFEDAGLNTQLLALASQVEWRIGDLEEDTLARTVDNQITIDRDAAGWGWNKAAARNVDSAQSERLNRTLYANRMHLASVIAHELGHVLGLGENDLEVDSIMYPWLSAGESRLNPEQIDAVIDDLLTEI